MGFDNTDQTIDSLANASEAETRGRGRAGLSRNTGLAKLFTNGSYFLIAYWIISTFFAIIPLRLADPLWVINSATSFVNGVTIPVAGVMFFHLAALLSPQRTPIKKHQHAMRKATSIAALFFLLLAPAVGFATYRGIKNVNSSYVTQKAQIDRKAAELITSTVKASTFLELRQNMKSLGGPELNQADAAKPLALLKESQINGIKQAQNTLIESLPKPTSDPYKPLYLNALRTALLSLISSMAFAALAWDPVQSRSLLQNLINPNVIGWLNPISLTKFLVDLARIKAKRSDPDPEEQQSKQYWGYVRDSHKRAKALEAQELRLEARELRQAQKLRDREKRLAQQQARKNKSDQRDPNR